MAKPVQAPMVAGKHPVEPTRFHVSSQDAQVEPSEGTPTLKLGKTLETLNQATPSSRRGAVIKPTRSPQCPPVAAMMPSPAAPVGSKGWKDLARTPCKRSRSIEKLPSPSGSAVAGLQLSKHALESLENDG